MNAHNSVGNKQALQLDLIAGSCAENSELNCSSVHCSQRMEPSNTGGVGSRTHARRPCVHTDEAVSVVVGPVIVPPVPRPNLALAGRGRQGGREAGTGHLSSWTRLCGSLARTHRAATRSSSGIWAAEHDFFHYHRAVTLPSASGSGSGPPPAPVLPACVSSSGMGSWCWTSLRYILFVRTSSSCVPQPAYLLRTIIIYAKYT